MAISLKGGSVYFLREKDYLSGEISPYVKIGQQIINQLKIELPNTNGKPSSNT